VVVKYWWSWLC